MISILTTSSIALWIVLLLNLLLTMALIRRFNLMSGHLVTDPTIDEGLEPGTPAPAFRAETLNGDSVTLSNYARRAVSFVFFSPHCEPCIEKLPALNALAPKAKDAGVEMILVNTDGGREETANLMQKYNLKLPVLLAPFDSNPFAKDYKAMGTPFFCKLNRNGEVEASGGFGSNWEQATLGEGRL